MCDVRCLMSGQRTRQKTGQRSKQEIGKKTDKKRGKRSTKIRTKNRTKDRTKNKRNDRTKKWDEKTEHYMAAWVYEFYLRVLKVSLTSERSERVRDAFSARRENSYPQAAMKCSFYFIDTDTDEIPTSYTTVFFFHFRNSKILQLKWSPIAKCLSQKCYETRIKSYKVEIKTIILMFLFQKVKILMKKRKIMLVTMATPISSHVKDKNSIFTARNEDMIFW